MKVNMFPNVSSKRLALVSGPILLIVCFFLPQSTSISEAARLSGVAFPEGPKVGLGVLLWTAAWWVTEVAPLGLTALIPVASYSIVGILSWKEALASFADPLVWVFI
ncbi:MAG: hypothetical protein QXU67_05020, partial [Candidatus Bathyarchaeia archaeon]